jgi:hypothetical protein
MSGAEETSRIDVFRELMKDPAAIRLPGDEGVTIPRWRLPTWERKFCMTVRRVCRALIKAGLARPESLQPLGGIIGIPILGEVEGN